MRALLNKLKIASSGSFLAELALYGLFVLVYFSLVLHFLDARLKQIFDDSKTHYAILSLALIAVQGVFLEMLTSALVRLMRRRAR